MQWFTSLDVWVQALLASLMMYLMTALGASFVFFSKKINKTVITALTGLAAGIMIAASFFSLLLPAIEHEGAVPAYITVTVGFALGGAFIVLSDYALSRSKLSFHAIGDKKNALLFLAVTLHNIPEGMSVGVAFAVGAAAADGSAALSAFLLAVGIAVQNFPEGMCVAFPLRAKGMSPLRSFLFSQGSGAIEIPAAILGAVAAAAIGGLLPWALSFSAGAMIAVVCSELIPECFSGNKTVASAGLVAGFCLMMILDVALG
ncbi:MAG: ZIP family metal transporter [Clostridia bacterium]|nr:ZIP family metal transporter [Clostridia bacterium]